MKAFSHVLAAMYDLAQHITPSGFPVEAIRLMQPLIDFDCAVLGQTDFKGSLYPELFIDRKFAQYRVLSLPKDCIEAPAENLRRSIFNDMQGPSIYDCVSFYGYTGQKELWHFARENLLSQILLFADQATPRKTARWLGLYRGPTNPFNVHDVTLLDALWPHLERATLFNLQCALRTIEASNADRSAALISVTGAIEIADPGFYQLLNQEWPQQDTLSIPTETFDAIRGGKNYRGQKIELSLLPRYGYSVCIARRLSLLNTLSPAEQSVAERFAKGQGYKKIAMELGTSPNTVRNQIAQTYRKLHIHDKAELTAIVLRQ